MKKTMGWVCSAVAVALAVVVASTWVARTGPPNGTPGVSTVHLLGTVQGGRPVGVLACDAPANRIELVYSPGRDFGANGQIAFYFRWGGNFRVRGCEVTCDGKRIGNVASLKYPSGRRAVLPNIRRGAKIKIVLTEAFTASISGTHELCFLEDPDGDNVFDEIACPPMVKVASGQAVRLEAIASSNDPSHSNMLIRPVDKFGNTDVNYTGKFSVSDFGTVHAKRALVRSSDGMETVSNPAMPCNGQHIYWGQMHGHSRESDGLGTADHYFTYARDSGHLDFAALSEHINPILGVGSRYIGPGHLTVDGWERVKAATDKHYVPGQFVTFLGFEWSTMHYGDKNAYYMHTDISFPSVLLADPKPMGALTVRDFYRTVKASAAPGKVMVISHMMNGILHRRGIDWGTFDCDLERLVEVCSYHGVKEHYPHTFDPCAEFYRDMPQTGGSVQDALSLGYRLGFTGGSDGHYGKPGTAVEPGGMVRTQTRTSIHGLTAVYADELTRESVWDALWNRRCYATTGARIILDFRVNGLPMGTITECEKRTFTARIHGTEPLRTVEVVKNNRVAYAVDGNGEYDVAFLWHDENPSMDTDCYYLRVTQEPTRPASRDIIEFRHMAWSSPVWLSRAKPGLVALSGL